MTRPKVDGAALIAARSGVPVERVEYLIRATERDLRRLNATETARLVGELNRARRAAQEILQEVDSRLEAMQQ